MNSPAPNRETREFSLSNYTLKTVDRLADLYGMDRAAIIELAVAHFDQVQIRGI